MAACRQIPDALGKVALLACGAAPRRNAADDVFGRDSDSTRLLLVCIHWRRPLRRRHLSRGHCQLMPTSRMNVVWGPNHGGSHGWSFREGQPIIRIRESGGITFAGNNRTRAHELGIMLALAAVRHGATVISYPFGARTILLSTSS